MTVKLGKTTRKALDLSKPHHLRRLRLPRDPPALNGVGTALVRTKTGPGLMIGSAEVLFILGFPSRSRKMLKVVMPREVTAA